MQSRLNRDRAAIAHIMISSYWRCFEGSCDLESEQVVRAGPETIAPNVIIVSNIKISVLVVLDKLED